MALAPPDTVLLFHGLGRMATSMRPMARALRRTGYAVRNVGYPSTRHPVARLARDVVAKAVDEARRDGTGRIHFVTHSMGGVLVRAYAEAGEVPEGARAVMLAPPHGGSELADRFRDTPLFRRVCGPALLELGTGPDSVCRSLGTLPPETGVIAGDRNPFPFFARHFGGPADGIVAVWSTKAAGFADHLVVPHGHTFLMRAPDVIRQTLHFLRLGRFDHESSP